MSNRNHGPADFSPAAKETLLTLRLDGDKCRLERWFATGELTCWNATEGRAGTAEQLAALRTAAGL